MSEVTLKELASAASRWIDRVEAGERVILMLRGRPAAVIMSMAEVEDFVLAEDPELAGLRAQARRDHDGGRSVALDEL